MRSELIGILLRLYPRWWRERYEAEFSGLLEEMPPTLMSLADIFVCAISVRLSSYVEDSMMHLVQRALPASFAAWLLAVAAGINLWASVDDNPLVLAMRSHTPFMNSWMLIEVGSLLGLAAVIAAGFPLLAAMFRERRQLLSRLLVIPGAVAVLILWFEAVLLTTRGHWAPMPWAITGDWVASPDWPSLTTRWIFGLTTLVLLLAAALASAIGFRETVKKMATSSLIRGSGIRRASLMLLAVSLVLMALSTGLWGLFANQYAPEIFHAKFGGLLNLSTFSSWLVSMLLFAAAAVIGVRGARLYHAAIAVSRPPVLF